MKPPAPLSSLYRVESLSNSLPVGRGRGRSFVFDPCSPDKDKSVVGPPTCCILTGCYVWTSTCSTDVQGFNDNGDWTAWTGGRGHWGFAWRDQVACLKILPMPRASRASHGMPSPPPPRPPSATHRATSPTSPPTMTWSASSAYSVHMPVGPVRLASRLCPSNPCAITYIALSSVHGNTQSKEPLSK